MKIGRPVAPAEAAACSASGVISVVGMKFSAVRRLSCPSEIGFRMGKL